MTKFKLSIYLIVVCVFMWGCDGIFDVEPSTARDGEEILTSDEGVEALRNSMYSQLRSPGGDAEENIHYTTEYFIGPSAMADETRNSVGSTRLEDLNASVSNDGSREHLRSWFATYQIVKDANQMISAVDEESLEDVNLDRYQGEAYALRAFAFHHLVRAMGYEPGMYDMGPEDNWDYGIVLQTDPVSEIDEVEMSDSRASVDEVYEQILSDLEEAAERLEGFEERNRITESFVHGLKARVKLYAANGDVGVSWEDAAASADNALDAFPGTLVDDPDGVDEMFVEDAGDHPEAMFLLEVHPDVEPIAGANVNNGPAAYTSSQWVAQVPTDAALNLYEEDDYRYNGWFEPCTNHQTGTDMQDNCEPVNENGWSVTKFNDHDGNLVDDMPYMRIAEIYLIKAEAEARASGSPDDGLDYLNTLRNARGVEDKDADDLEEFEDLILRERGRELIVEGHRFWDLKRMGRHIPDVDGSNKIRNDNYRMLAPVPTREQGVNDDLIENPEY